MLHVLFHTQFFPFLSGFLFHRLTALALYDNNALSLWLSLPEMIQRLCQRRGKRSLMLLGQFPANGCPALSQCLQQFFQCPYQPMRCLIQNDGPHFCFQFFQNRLFLLLIRWKKCFKTESSGGQSRQRQRRNACSRSRKGRNLNSSLVAQPYQILTRIRNARCTGIRDQCHIFSFLHLLNQVICLIDLIIFMITGHRRLNLKMIQQLDTVSCIFCCNQICFF